MTSYKFLRLKFNKAIPRSYCYFPNFIIWLFKIQNDISNYVMPSFLNKHKKYRIRYKSLSYFHKKSPPLTKVSPTSPKLLPTFDEIVTNFNKSITYFKIIITYFDKIFIYLTRHTDEINIVLTIIFNFCAISYQLTFFNTYII